MFHEINHPAMYLHDSWNCFVMPSVDHQEANSQPWHKPTEPGRDGASGAQSVVFPWGSGGKCGFSAMNHQEEWQFHGKRLDEWP